MSTQNENFHAKLSINMQRRWAELYGKCRLTPLLYLPIRCSSERTHLLPHDAFVSCIRMRAQRSNLLNMRNCDENSSNRKS